MIRNVFKIVVLGDPSVGKTTLRLRYIGEGFRKQYVATLGVDFGIATHKDNILQIWDLGGQYDFRSMIKTFYFGAQGVILVFDVTNRESMKNILNWIDGYVAVETKDVPMVIFGNKIDLRDESETSITTDEANKFVGELCIKYETDIKYIETSALTGDNIKSAFEGLVEDMTARARI